MNRRLILGLIALTLTVAVFGSYTAGVVFAKIIAGKRSVTGDTALRFGHWFGVDPQFWLNLQAQFDLAAADRRVGAVVRTLPTADRSA